MKTLDQIFRYTSDCRFPEDDWQKVLDYCRERYGGGKIHKSRSPKGDSTYVQFLDWIDNDFGAGDMVSYGKTMGIVGLSVPGKTVLAAYCDWEGNLVVNDMEVMHPEKLKPLDPERKDRLRLLMYDAGVDFYVRVGMMDKVYTPEKYFHVIVDNGDEGEPDVGMYLESDGCKNHFLAYLSNGKLKMDCWIDCGCTPLKKAGESDVRRLHAATTKAGWAWNERCHQFLKTTRKGVDNIYWYLNEFFKLVKDKDDGSKIHQLRYEAGNYILDYYEGLTLMKEVRKMRGKA